jgi:iron complex transport system substrate-binding protein
VTDSAVTPLQRPANKVIIIPPMSASYLTLDETAAHILALSPSQHDYLSKGLIGSIYPNLKSAPTSLGLDDAPMILNPEQMMVLKPDALFSWPWKAELLHRIGFRGLVEIDPISSKLPDLGALDVLRLFGRISGHCDRARQLADRYEESYALIRASLSTAPDLKSLSVAVLFASESQSQAGKGYPFAQSYLVPLGATIAANTNSYTLTSLERLLVLDPDIILIDSESDHDTPADIYDKVGWHALRAVKNRRVYRIPNHFDKNIIVEGPLLLRWTAEILYPRQMSNQLRTLFKDSFREVYSHDICEDEIDKEIFLHENIISFGYERFLRYTRHASKLGEQR